MDVADGRWRNLTWIVLAQLFAMSTWFSVAAVGPALSADWGVSREQLGLLAVAVQLGFVAGGLVVAMLGLADWLPPRQVFAGAALTAAAANGVLMTQSGFGPPALIARFALGAALAGVYPIGMKIMTGWFRAGRGLALGALVGALTLGSAAPHLLAGLELSSHGSWQPVIVLTSLLACAAAITMLALVGDGPFVERPAGFKLATAVTAMRRPIIGYVTLGYLGHMWELYAMWTWIPAYLAASFAAAAGASGNASLAAAVVIGAGSLGCVAGGVGGDRIGHVTAAGASMIASGMCAVAAGLLFGQAPVLVLLVCVAWGISVIADSAQFSAAIARFSHAEEVGSVLALQTAFGFAIAAVSIQLLPLLVSAGGWPMACISLSVGPILGTWALTRARRAAAMRPT